MKKVVLFFLVAVMVFSLVGCGAAQTKAESKYTKDTADAMEVVIDIADKVLAGEYPAKKAEADIEKIVESMDISYIDGKDARDLAWTVWSLVHIYCYEYNSEEQQKECLETLEIARNRLYEALYG